MPPLLRYGVFELALVQPLIAGFWRAPEAPYEGPWPPADWAGTTLRENLDRGFRDRLAREPATATAPAALPAELALLAVEALAAAALRRAGNEFLVTIGPLGRAAETTIGFRAMAERAAARRLAVTAETAPRPRSLDAILVMLTILFAADPARRLRGLPPAPPPPWTFAVAAQAVRTFNRRRSWRRAYAAASASQDLSSASSSTSAVCAPDTP